MKKILALLLAVLVSSSALCDERPSVTDMAPSGSLKDTISAAARAFDSEDLDSYEGCFKESKRKSVRRQAALLFASHSCSLELMECHVMEMGDAVALAAVRYKLGLAGEDHDVVSTVKFVLEGDRWLIDQESSVRRLGRPAAQSVSYSSPPGGNWDPLNPDPARIPQGLHHLMGDIGIRPGMGCADGKCAGGRCEVR